MNQLRICVASPLGAPLDVTDEKDTPIHGHDYVGGLFRLVGVTVDEFVWELVTDQTVVNAAAIPVRDPLIS